MVVKRFCAHTNNEQETIKLGTHIGQILQGGEIIELSSDLGGGKTTFTKGLAQGIGSSDVVSSPTFTLANVYTGQALTIHHYDFYRLDELGVMKDVLLEAMQDDTVVAVVEWAGEAHDFFPGERLIRIEIGLVADDEQARALTISVGQDRLKSFRQLELYGAILPC